MNELIHYCGHIISADESGRFPKSKEQAVEQAISDTVANRKITACFGSLASGADILFAEAMLNNSASLHVVLPFSEQIFLEKSVLASGSNWQLRFEYLLQNAQTTTQLYNIEVIDDNVAYALCTEIAMGLCLLESSQSERVKASQLTLWDGQRTEAIAGTYPDMQRWSCIGLESKFILSKSPTAASVFFESSFASNIPLDICFYLQGELQQSIDVNQIDKLFSQISASTKDKHCFIDLNQQHFGSCESQKSENISHRALALIAYRCCSNSKHQYLKKLTSLCEVKTS